jgi:hypothetical protein
LIQSFPDEQLSQKDALHDHQRADHHTLWFSARPFIERRDRVALPKHIPLYGVGDYLQTKAPFELHVKKGKPVPTTTVAWHVIEVNTQTCAAGSQHWYICRPHIPEVGRYERSFRDWAGNDLRKFNQIEMEPYRQPQNEESGPTSEDLSIIPVATMRKVIRLLEPVVAGLRAEESQGSDDA